MLKNNKFNRNGLKATAWKNGKGITREIVSSKPNAAYWRFSIADVKENGDFSLFPELERILTVVEGKGMTLSTPNGDMSAEYAKPIYFAGDLPIYGKLLDGDVQNFNLIYDATKIEAVVGIGGVEISSPEQGENTIIGLIYCLNTQQGWINPRDEILLKQSNSSQILCFNLMLKR